MTKTPPKDDAIWSRPASVLSRSRRRKRKSKKGPQSSPFQILFPEVHAWIKRGAPVRIVAVYFAVTLATLVVYAPLLWHEVVNLSGREFVRGNLHFTSGLTFANILWAFRSGYSGVWQPLTWLSYMRDFQFAGAGAAAMHLDNSLLHTANAVLLLFTLRWLTGSRWRSAFVAAIFALHPLNVEAVSLIADRNNLIGTLFFLLTILAYGQFLERGGRRRYVFMLLLFVLGLMASPAIVILPFLLLLIDYWPLERLASFAELRHLFVEKIPLFALSAGSGLVTFLVHKRSVDSSVFDTVSRNVRLDNSVLSCGRYLRRIFWPNDLVALYPYRQSFEPRTILAVGIVLVFVTIGVIWLRRRKPYLVTGWLWFLGTLLPVIGLVQIGASAMADRYAYLPAIGIMIGVTWALADLFASLRLPGVVVASAVTTIICVCLLKSVFQLGYWKDTTTLLQHSIRIDPENYLALERLGDELVRRSQLDKALVCFNQALRLRPNRPFTRAESATILYSLGRTSEAAAQYQEALRMILPLRHRMTRSDRSRAASVMNDLAWIRATAADPQLRDPGASLQLANASIELSGDDTKAAQYGTLAAAQAENGQFKTAAATARRGLLLAQARGKRSLAEAIRQCLIRYESRRPVRQFSKRAVDRQNAVSQSGHLELDGSVSPIWSEQDDRSPPRGASHSKGWNR